MNNICTLWCVREMGQITIGYGTEGTWNCKFWAETWCSSFLNPFYTYARCTYTHTLIQAHTHLPEVFPEQKGKPALAVYSNRCNWEVEIKTEL